MAAHFPAKLRAHDLGRFNLRAAQLEKARPVVSYWCEYWIVNQILAKGLTTGDEDVLAYTKQLVDKLERIKAAHADNDAIIDDAAGQAYVEQFALETFMRADRAVQADQVTKQTADTFLAAASFLELVNIWTVADAETNSKIKYAKWNAVRIIKALKDGKDPNETNPKQQASSPDAALPALDPDDPEVQQLQSKQPYVEDDHDQDLPTSSSQAHVPRQEVERTNSSHAGHLTTQNPNDDARSVSEVSARGSPMVIDPAHPLNEEVSPLEPSPNERSNSVGGGYFPAVPSDNAHEPDPSQTTVQSQTDDPHTFYSQEAPVAPSAPRANATAASHHSSAVAAPYRKPAFSPSVPTVTGVEMTNSQLNTDDVAITKAQKHARFAISALNFEDAETAVKELRAALHTLGAS